MAYQAPFKRSNSPSWGWTCLISISLLLQLPLCLAADYRIAVLYPETEGRGAKLYATIIKGMQTDDVYIQTRSLNSDTQNDDIHQWLREQDSQAVIMLGKQGQGFSLQIDLKIPVVTGAHIAMQKDRSAVSLAADPKQLFAALKQLKPNVRRVHVIYNENNSGWLIKRAQRAASHNNIKLNAIRTDTIQASGRALRNILESANPQHDAIWLQLDPILPIKPLLPDLLRTAWQRNLIVFSGNPYHVQQGILFALYPNYKKLGRQLVELAIDKVKKRDTAPHEPSRYLKSALNARTASHLGIQISSRKMENFNLVFPVR